VTCHDRVYDETNLFSSAKANYSLGSSLELNIQGFYFCRGVAILTVFGRIKAETRAATERGCVCDPF